MRINSMEKRYSDRERQSTDLRMDSKGKEVQSQIIDAKNRLKELSSDHALNEDEKERKRQQIQQQLAELKKELRQRQLELQRTQQENPSPDAPLPEKNSKASDTRPTQAQSAEPKSPATQNAHAGTKAIIAAGSAVNRASAHEKLANELESKIRILQGEIRQDEARGKDTSYKQKEQKKLESKAARLGGTGIDFLADASKELRTAMEKETGFSKKTRSSNPDGFVRPLKSPLSATPKAKTDIYIKRNLFSTVDFHF